MIVKGFMFISCYYSLVPPFSSRHAFKFVRLGDVGLKVNLAVYGKMVAGSGFSVLMHPRRMVCL